MTRESQQDKEEFFEKFTQIINDYFDEYEYAKNKAKMGGKMMAYEFKSGVQVDNLWQWIESKKVQWQREAREMLMLDVGAKLLEFIEEVRGYQWDMCESWDDEARVEHRMIKYFLDDLTSSTNQS